MHLTPWLVADQLLVWLSVPTAYRTVSACSRSWSDVVASAAVTPPVRRHGRIAQAVSKAAPRFES